MLTNRQLLILQVIIDDFISTAQPVGSRNLSKKEGISLSSATIRNEMADLEEMGYLEKTHTSSGRIPSEKGYRYYVDHLISPQKLKNDEIYKLKSVFKERLFELEKIVQRSAGILSEITNYTTIMLGPAVAENHLRRIQIIPLDKSTAIAIIVTDTGHVENRTIYLPPGVDPNEMERVVNILNDRLAGVPLIQLKDKIYKEVAMLLKQHITNYDMVLHMLASSLQLPATEKLFFGGKANMLSQPEFHDVEKVKAILDIMEQEKDLYQLVSNNPEGINVKIGRENENMALENCSIISATYSIGDENLGTIAVLGPTRMDYSRVISLLSFFSKDLSSVLTKQYQNKSQR